MARAVICMLYNILETSQLFGVCPLILSTVLILRQIQDAFMPLKKQTNKPTKNVKCEIINVNPLFPLPPPPSTP